MSRETDSTQIRELASAMRRGWEVYPKGEGGFFVSHGMDVTLLMGVIEKEELQTCALGAAYVGTHYNTANFDYHELRTALVQRFPVLLSRDYVMPGIDIRRDYIDAAFQEDENEDPEQIPRLADQIIYLSDMHGTYGYSENQMINSLLTLANNIEVIENGTSN